MRFVILSLIGAMTLLSPRCLSLYRFYLNNDMIESMIYQKLRLKNSYQFAGAIAAVFAAAGIVSGAVGWIFYSNHINLNILTGLAVMLLGLTFVLNRIPWLAAFVGSALLLAAQGGGIFWGTLSMLAYYFFPAILIGAGRSLYSHIEPIIEYVENNHSVFRVVFGGFLIFSGLMAAAGAMNL
ncbi:MAG: hypothetical protein FWH14_08635 [Oscillospiraceae bacterium]|nr:hypothetical protein [Oscillospiraceae bacterium]